MTSRKSFIPKGESGGRWWSEWYVREKKINDTYHRHHRDTFYTFPFPYESGDLDTKIYLVNHFKTSVCTQIQLPGWCSGNVSYRFPHPAGSLPLMYVPGVGSSERYLINPRMTKICPEE